MIKKKPYEQMAQQEPLTQETAVLGILVKDWHQAFTSNFEESLKFGNELMDTMKTSTPEKIIFRQF